MRFLSLSDFEINTTKYDTKVAEIHHAQHVLFESLNDQQKDLASSRFRFAFATIRAFGSIDKRLQIIEQAGKNQDRKWKKEKKIYLGIFAALMVVSFLVGSSVLEALAVAVAFGVYVLLAYQESVPPSNRAFNKITSLEISRINLVRDAESVGVTPALLECLQRCEDKMNDYNQLIVTQFDNLHSIVSYQIRMEIMKDILNRKLDPKLDVYTLNPHVELK